MDKAAVFRQIRPGLRRKSALPGWVSILKPQGKTSYINGIFRYPQWMGGVLQAVYQRRALMAGTDQPSPWWSASRHADRKPFLMARAAITRALRAWFDEQGF